LDLSAGQDERYATAAAEFGGAIERLARAYEADADPRRDLIDEIDALRGG
jgi:RNA polymerase sigma-70 factor (ECF subfamily)